MGLRIIFSNRIEALEKQFLKDMDRLPSDPFAPQHVVAPGTAVSRHLELAIARDKGICANVNFSYPGKWLWDLARTVDNKVPERSPVDPAVMVWLLLRILKTGSYGSYPRLNTFIKNADDLMLFEFAESLAKVFDHYATYRPDWLTEWSRGRRIPDCTGSRTCEEDEGWQSEIWRAVSGELKLGATHPLQTFLDTIKSKTFSCSEPDFPECAAIFAVPVIPPLYLQTICRLSEVMDITIYMLNPCREYWFEIVPPKQLAWLKSVKRDAHREVGHLLLADWGRATQAAIDLIYEEAIGAQTTDESLFIEPEGNSLLARLQRSILDMEELLPGEIELCGTDRSIEFHCCHSPVRELEVLHNRLLEMFDADRSLRAGDIVVLTPDIDSLAPAIDAVFGTAPDTHKIPYLIAGRSMASTNPYLQVLLELLDLLTSRMPASRVFDLLRRDPVARKFQLDSEDLGRIRSWVESSGMRWGIDSEHRKQMKISKEERHTFRWGMDSLFLGFAVSGLDRPLAGLLPSESLEGSRSVTLGKLWLFIGQLDGWRKRLRFEQSADDWQGILNELLADFTSPDDVSREEYEMIAGEIAGLADNWRLANLTHNVSSRIVRAALADADISRRGAVPSGKVTFASLSAMRGLSYRAVCLIGMNDGSWPGNERPIEFDLIPQGKPRRGDRQKRMEDRGIFLDTILAARDALHISYTGRDQRNNSEIPPSVLVAQLIDYLARASASGDAADGVLSLARSRLIVNHPLQPFSRRYFDGSDPCLYSYVAQYAHALNSSAKPGGSDMEPVPEEDGENGREPDTAPPFFNAVPKIPDAAAGGPRTLTIDDLSSFLRNTSRFFLQKRLMIRLTQADDLIEDEEPLDVGLIRGNNMADIVIDACLKQRRIIGMNEALTLLRGSPEAPPDSVCAAYLSAGWQKISSLAERLLDATAEPKMEPCHHVLSLSDGKAEWQLRAGFSDLRPCGLVSYRCDDLRGFDNMQAWLRHLVLCASRPEGVKPESRRLAFDKDLSIGEIARDEAERHLVYLLGLYDEGFFRPVPFFRRSSWEYAENKSLDKARYAWSGGYTSKGASEMEDVWHALAWRGVSDALDDEFQEIAETLFRPLIDKRVVTKVVITV